MLGETNTKLPALSPPKHLQKQFWKVTFKRKLFESTLENSRELFDFNFSFQFFQNKWLDADLAPWDAFFNLGTYRANKDLGA